MKIAIITDYWKNSGGGGIKTFLINLYDAIKEINPEVIVLYRDGIDPENYCGGKNKILFSIRCYVKLTRSRSETIHTHGTWYCLLPGVLYKKIHGCTLIHTFHTEPYNKLSFPGKYFYQVLLDNCDSVSFVSNRLKQRIEEIDGLSFSRTEITYAGVIRLNASNGEIRGFRTQYGIEEDAIVLLAQGMTAHPLKADGLKMLINAILPLRTKYPNLILIATRQGQFSEELKTFTRELGLEKQVIFTGDVKNPFIPLEICDIYTHITLGDGLPLALLEAMAAGKPIVATSVGGIPEAIVDGQNGLFAIPEVNSIAERIDFILSNPEIAHKLGNCAQSTAEQKFTWGEAMKRFWRCYRNEFDEDEMTKVMINKR